jgi:hypothetical protein
VIFNDIKQGDRVRWSNTDQRGTVRTVGQATILVEWEDGRVRGYDLQRNNLHRIYVPPARELMRETAK